MSHAIHITAGRTTDVVHALGDKIAGSDSGCGPTLLTPGGRTPSS